MQPIGRQVLDQGSTNDPRLNAEPFWILQLTPKATTSEVEQAYIKIKSKLSLGVDSATEYQTPFGVKVRDEYGLRDARSQLITPESRLLAEFWYVESELDSSGSTEARTQNNLDAYAILKIQPINSKRARN